MSIQPTSHKPLSSSPPFIGQTGPAAAAQGPQAAAAPAAPAAAPGASPASDQYVGSNTLAFRGAGAVAAGKALAAPAGAAYAKSAAAAGELASVTSLNTPPKAAGAASAAAVTGAKVGSPDNPAVFDGKGKLNPAALKAFSQYDKEDATTGDEARCSCNSTVTALAMRGKDDLIAGIEGVKKDLMKEITDNPLNPAILIGNTMKLAELNALQEKAKTNSMTTKDLNQFAETMYQRFDSDKSDSIIKYPDMLKMQKAVGLLPADMENATDAKTVSGPKVGTVTYPGNAPPSSDFNVDSKQFHDAQKKVANDVLKGIKPGESALVGVFNGGGGTDQPNHILTVGKNKSGQTYVYDPGNEPHYMTGKAAEKHLQSMIGVSMGPGKLADGSTWDEKTQPRRDQLPLTREVTAAATVIPQKPKAAP